MGKATERIYQQKLDQHLHYHERRKNLRRPHSAKTHKLAVIGLGYVGLPIALEFARKISVIGFDINSQPYQT